MNCHRFREGLFDVARRTADESTRVELEAHLEACPSCRRHLEEQQQLTIGLRAVATDAGGDGPSAGLEERLLAMFAEERAGVAAVSPGRRAGDGYRLAAWLGAAAILVLGVGAVLARYSGGPTGVPAGGPAPPPAPRLAVAGPGGPVEVSATWAGSGSVQTDLLRQPRAAMTAVGVSPRMVPAAGFTLLPEALWLPAFESGEIVRLEMIVSALPAYGLQIPADAGDSPIQVDLLVGQDGHPRAIRLVTYEMQQPRSRQ